MTYAAKPKQKNEAGGQPHLTHTTFLFFPRYCQSEMQKLSRTIFKLKSPQRNKGCKSENTTFNSVLWPQAPQTLLLGRPCGWSPGHTSASFKVTQISDWLHLGYKIIGRNFTSSVLCGFFAIQQQRSLCLEFWVRTSPAVFAIISR